MLAEEGHFYDGVVFQGARALEEKDPPWVQGVGQGFQNCLAGFPFMAILERYPFYE